MARETVFESSLSPYIKGFIDEKRSQGFKYVTEEQWMKKFDEYWIQNGYTDPSITPENLELWMRRRDCEGAKCQCTRISVVRQFSKYISSLETKTA